MPNRILRDCCDSVKVNAVSVQAERLFYRLIQKVDDYGRLPAAPAYLRPLLFPWLLDTVREADLSRWLDELATAREALKPAGLIRLYEVEGKSYLEIRDFRQRLRADASKYPAPPPDLPDDGQATVKRPPDDRHPTALSSARAQANAPPAKHGSGKPPRAPARSAREAPEAAAADLRSEMLDLGISGKKVDELLPTLEKAGVSAVHMHLLAHELRRKKGIDDVASVAVARLSNGFVAREYLSIPEVVMLAKKPGILSLAGRPVTQPMTFNSGAHDPGVFWSAPDGTKCKAGPNDLRADAVVLGRAR